MPGTPDPDQNKDPSTNKNYSIVCPLYASPPSNKANKTKQWTKQPAYR